MAIPADQWEHIEDIEPLLQEGQNPKIVLALYDKIRTMLVSNERVVAVFHQYNAWLIAGIVFTQERVIFYRPVIIGGAKVDNYYLKFLGEPTLLQGIIFSRITVQHRFENNIQIKMGWLPKKQARRAYAMFKDQCMYWHDEWRYRMYDEYKAKAGGVNLRQGLAATDMMAAHKSNPLNPMNAQAPVSSMNIRVDPVEAILAPMSEPGHMTQPHLIEHNEQGEPVTLEQSMREVDQVFANLRTPEAEMPQVADVPLSPRIHVEELPEAQKLRELNDLFTSGTITQEEYQAKRTEILENF